MYQLNNLFYGELDLSGGDITSGASTITLSSGDVANLEITPTATDPAIFMIWDKAYETGGAARRAGGKVELISVTGKDEGADTLTAGTRGFSNTTAQSYNSADSTTYGIVQVAAEEVFTQYRSVQMVDQWSLTTNFSGTSTPITANLSRSVAPGFTQIGNGVTESSGIFSFPEEGVYLIEFHGSHLLSDVDESIDCSIFGTKDDSTYNFISVSSTHIDDLAGVSSTRANNYTSGIFHVEDTSTDKIQFRVVTQNASTTTSGSSGNENRTYMTFIKLGDT